MREDRILAISPRVETDALGRPVGKSLGARFEVRGRITVILVALILFLLIPCLHASDCVSIQEARQHIDENQCVTGKVVRVKIGSGGVTFLDFCEDQMACPFTVAMTSALWV